MNNIAKQNIQIVTNTGNSEKAIAQIQKAFDKNTQGIVRQNEKLSRSANKAAKSSNVLQGKFRDAARSAAVLEGPLGSVAGRISSIGTLLGSTGFLIGAATVGIGSLAIGMGFAAKATAEFESQQGKLNAILKTTGGAAGVTADQIESLSQSIARSTLASTQGVREASGVLLSFTNIVGSNFERTLELSQDLAATLGGDIKTKTQQLAKALEDPKQGLDRLKQSGVSFTDQEKETIKVLAASGKQFEAQAIILDKVQAQVGGAGAGAGGGLAGASDSLSQSWNNLLVSIGQTTDIASTAAGAIDRLSKTIQGLAGVESLPLEEQQELLALQVKGLEKLKEIRGESLLANGVEIKLLETRTKLAEVNQQLIVSAGKQRQAEREFKEKSIKDAQDAANVIVATESLAADKRRIKILELQGDFKKAEELKTKILQGELDKRFSDIKNASLSEAQVGDIRGSILQDRIDLEKAQRQKASDAILAGVKRQNEQLKIQALRSTGEFVAAEEAKLESALRVDQERLAQIRKRGESSAAIEKQFADRAVSLESQKAQAIMKIRNDAVAAIQPPDFNEQFDLVFNSDASSLDEISEKLLALPELKEIFVKTELVETSIDLSNIPESINIPVDTDLDTLEGFKELLNSLPDVKEVLVDLGIGEEFDFSSFNIPNRVNIPVDADTGTLEGFKDVLTSIDPIREVLIEANVLTETFDIPDFDFSNIPSSIDIPVNADTDTLEGLQQALLSLPELKSVLVDIGLDNDFNFDNLNIPDQVNLPVNADTNTLEGFKQTLSAIEPVREILIQANVIEDSFTIPELDFSGLPESIDIPVDADTSTLEGLKDVLLSIPEVKNVLIDIGVGEQFDFASLDNIPSQIDLPVNADFATVTELQAALLEIPEVKSILIDVGLAEENIRLPDFSQFIPPEPEGNPFLKRLEQFDVFATAQKDRQAVLNEELFQFEIQQQERMRELREQLRADVVDAETNEQINDLEERFTKEQELTKVVVEEAKRRTREKKKAEDAGFANFKSNLSKSLNFFAGNSRKVFEIQKAASTAAAVVNTAEGVTKALSAYPPPLSFAMAGAQLAAGTAQIGAIQSQSFGSGGSVSAPSGSVPTPSAVEDIETFSPETVATEINITVDGSIDPAGTRRLIEAVNEQVGDGFNFNVNAA